MVDEFFEIAFLVLEPLLASHYARRVSQKGANVEKIDPSTMKQIVSAVRAFLDRVNGLVEARKKFLIAFQASGARDA